MDPNVGHGLLTVAALCAVAAGWLARRPVATIVRVNSVYVGTDSPRAEGVAVHCLLDAPLCGCLSVVFVVEPSGDYYVWGRPDAGTPRVISTGCAADTGTGPGVRVAIRALSDAGYKVRRR